MSAAGNAAPAVSTAKQFRIDFSSAEGGTPGIIVTHTAPESIQFHLIEDHELEVLMNVSPPVWFGISMASLGACLGLTPESVRIFVAVRQAAKIDASDLVTACVWTACLVLFGVTLIFSTNGLRKAGTALKAIRTRPASPLSFGDQQQGPSSN